MLRSTQQSVIWMAGGLAMLAMLAGSAAPLHADAQGQCRPAQVKFRAASSSPVFTDSDEFVPVPNSLVRFTQGGTAPSCVIVTFSAEAHAPDCAVVVRPRIWGIGPVAVPSRTELYGNNSSYFGWNTHTMQFVFPGVPPGEHTLVMDFRKSLCAGDVVGLRQFFVNVQHRP